VEPTRPYAYVATRANRVARLLDRGSGTIFAEAGYAYEGVYPQSSNASRDDDSLNDAFFNGFPNTPTANPPVSVKIVKRHAAMRVHHWSLARGLSVTIGGLADDTGTLIVTITGLGTRHHYHHTYRAHSKLGEYSIARSPAIKPGLYRITLTYTGDPHRYPITLTHTAHTGTR
jgi:hypothetical protein